MWRGNCACDEDREYGGSEQRHLAARFWSDAKRGGQEHAQTGQKGVMRPAKALAASP